MNQPRDNSGALFKNTRKESDSHPDYNGTVRVNGVDMWISAWLKESSKGSRYLSLSFKPKDGQTQSYDKGRSKPMPSGGFTDDDSEIPF